MMGFLAHFSATKLLMLSIRPCANCQKYDYGRQIIHILMRGSMSNMILFDYYYSRNKYKIMSSEHGKSNVACSLVSLGGHQRGHPDDSS